MVDPRRDSRVAFRRFANRVHESGAHGGQLFATAGGLTFRPHRLDRSFMNAAIVEIPWAEVDRIETAHRQFRGIREAALQGGIRRRLRVVRRDGTQELFIVNQVDSIARQLREVQDAARSAQ